MRDNDVEIVQFNYSLGDRLAAERLLPTAADRGIAVMINVPFGGGRDSIFDVVEGRELPDFAAEFDARRWGQFFLKYIVSHPAVTVRDPGHAPRRARQRQLRRGVRPLARRRAAAASRGVLRLALLTPRAARSAARHAAL